MGDKDNSSAKLKSGRDDLSEKTGGQHASVFSGTVHGDRGISQQQTGLKQAMAYNSQENKYIQLMILLAAGEVESCKWNAHRLYQKIFEQKEAWLSIEKGQAEGGNPNFRWTKQDTFVFVNIGLLYVKCLMMSDDKEKIKPLEILSQCKKVLIDGLYVDTSVLKKSLSDIYTDKIDNANVQQADEKSSFRNGSVKPSAQVNRRRMVDFNEFRWLLSSYGAIASFYNSLGFTTECERIYVKYVTLIEDFYQKDS